MLGFHFFSFLKQYPTLKRRMVQSVSAVTPGPSERLTSIHINTADLKQIKKHGCKVKIKTKPSVANTSVIQLSLKALNLSGMFAVRSYEEVWS